MGFKARNSVPVHCQQGLATSSFFVLCASLAEAKGQNPGQMNFCLDTLCSQCLLSLVLTLSGLVLSRGVGVGAKVQSVWSGSERSEGWTPGLRGGGAYLNSLPTPPHLSSPLEN